MTRMRRVAKMRTGQGRDHHGAFALAVDLHEARPHHADGPLDVGGIHRRAAVHDGLEAGAIGARRLRVVDQPLDDGGRGEHRQPAQCGRQLEDLRWIEPARGRDHVTRAGHHVRDGIEAGAVRHRRRVDDRVTRIDRVHVDEVGQAHRHQVAVAQHHALGFAGGAARVEQPRQVLGGARGDRRRREREQRFVIGPGDLDGAAGRGQSFTHIGGHEGPERLRVVHDPLCFAQVQLCIHRHDRQAGPPRAVQHLQVRGVVAHEQRDAVAGPQAGRVQRGSQPRRPIRQARIVAQQPISLEEGRAAWIGQRYALQRMGEVHTVQVAARFDVSSRT